MRPHTQAEAVAVVDAVEDWQDVFAAVLGRRLVHAADEYYLLAERPFPPAERYEAFLDARGRHRHGPHVRARVRRAVRRRHGTAAWLLRRRRRRITASQSRRLHGVAVVCRDGAGRHATKPAGAGGDPDRGARRACGRATRRSSGLPGCPHRAGAQRVLRRQHGSHRPHDGNGPARVSSRTSRPDTATCCQTSACPTTVASSMVAPSRTCRDLSRW